MEPVRSLAKDIFEHGRPPKTPLPGDESTWEACTLGQPSTWPETLRAFSRTITSFAYPAAIFWSEQFHLFYNEAWIQAGGVAEQGKAQRGRFTPDTWNTFNAIVHGGKPRRLSSHQLLRNGLIADATDKYSVLISPIFNPGDNGADEAPVGLLAQLIEKTREQERRPVLEPSQQSHAALKQTAEGHLLNLSNLGEVVDKFPLDEHPFFHRFAEMIPSGLAILNHTAQAVFVNQLFYELTTHYKEDKSFQSWPQSIHPDDFQRVMDAYRDAFNSQQQLRIEFRAVGQNHPWRLLLLTPLGDENLQHVSLREYGGFVCSIVDITSEKAAELDEREAAREARRRKAQQERFIDMISHEIRNPLSAILHCTEDIEEATRNTPVNVDVIKDGVETINLCISHQQNIVDDVLSFSKLDASMLTLAPKPCEPSRQLGTSLKMFYPEFRKHSIEFEFRVDQSYHDIGIQWVMADLPRIGQVLVNLVTNAIKFTARSEGEKRIVVSIGGSKERPKSFPSDVVFFGADESSVQREATSAKDWGDGEPLFIMLAVKDTGIGISEEGQKKLFERFRQVTPKTGEVYSGSGLGLNISRKMSHLHGGEVGVAAKEDQGSTFAFFFEVRSMEHAVQESQSRGKVSESQKVTRQMERNASESLIETEFELKNQGRASDALAAQQQSRDADPSTDADLTSDRQRTEPPARKGRDQNLHVLLVEDNVINQRVVLRKLENKGLTVTAVNNGGEAVDFLLQQQQSTSLPADAKSAQPSRAVDVILMDQDMPVLDGNAATRKIRKLEETGEIKAGLAILGVSANVRGGQQDSMLESGMDDVIGKPYKIDEIVYKIRGILDTAAEREARAVNSSSDKGEWDEKDKRA